MIQRRMIHRIVLVLAVVVVTVVTTINAQAQTTSVKPCSAGRFFVTGESGRQHLAPSPLSLASTSTSSTTATPTLTFDTCDYFYKACDQKAGDLRESCEFRDEGGGGGAWGYTSCNCQGLREYKRCMEDNGCANHPSQQFDLEQHPECFGIQ